MEIRHKITAVWSILDQMTISLTNFTLHIVLARQADPDIYGLFVVVSALLVIISSVFQSSLTFDPLIILGGKIKEKTLDHIYYRQTFVLHILISLVSIIVLLISSLIFWFFGNTIYARATLIASIPILFSNLRLFMRCFQIMKGDFFSAFRIDFSMALVVGFGVLTLAYIQKVNEWSIIALMVIADGIVVLLLIVTKPRKSLSFLSSLIFDIKKEPRFWIWESLQRNWKYGKWLLIAYTSNQVYQSIQFLLLPIFISSVDLAGYRACSLLAQPIHTFATGIEAYVWHRSVKLLPNRNALLNFIQKSNIIVSIFIISYFLLIQLALNDVYNLLFDGKYFNYSSLLWFFASGLLIASLGKMIGTIFRVMEFSEILSKIALYIFITSLPTFLLLTSFAGLVGAATNMVISNLVSLTLLLLHWKKLKVKQTIHDEVKVL